MSGEAQTFEFQAQTRQLLDIVIHSLYSNKEIFLRELISNASDALDRLRFESLTDDSVMDGAEVLEIRLKADTEARTLTVEDNGIGMTRQEVIENLGTIAKSGTRELMQSVGEGSSPEGLAELIGQFGVGFYSAFMVADRVTVVTRRAGEDQATRWESDGGGEYEIGDDSRFMRGTSVTLHLKDVDAENGIEDYTDVMVMSRLVRRYSDFVGYPIVTKQTRRQPDLDDEGKPVPGSEKDVVEEITLNSMRPIWTRSRDSVTDEEYTQFYQHVSHDWNAPLETLSLRAEGRIEYQALLFIPSQAPIDLFYRDHSWGLQLYVRRVLIMDRCEELLPPYLRFIRGVVDSSDLPLNVSREMIQHDRHIRQMRQWLTRKILDHLAKMKRDDPDTYGTLWSQFGTLIKEGASSDAENRDRILPLLLFSSTHDESELTDLGGYIERLGTEGGEILYLTGESRELIASSPHLEGPRAAGREVLFMSDPIDEFLVQTVGEFEGHALKSASLASLEGDGDSAAEADASSGDLESLLTALRAPLSEEIREVRASSRLTDSPARLTGEAHDLSPQLERILRQTQGEHAVPRQKRILEINPRHELVRHLADLSADGEGDATIERYARLLYDYALLAEGSEFPDAAGFRQRFGELLVDSLRSEPSEVSSDSEE